MDKEEAWDAIANSDSVTALARTLGLVCGTCMGRGALRFEHVRGSMQDEPCPACSATGLDPAAVEALRAFERDVIRRCAGVCRHEMYCGPEKFSAVTIERVAAAIEVGGK